MSGTVVALLVAVVGVFGTLSSPIVAQRLSAKTKREEMETQHQHALDSRDQVRLERIYQEKRLAYITYTTTSRRYRVELMNYLHAVNRDDVNDADRAELREARLAWSAALAEIQIMADGTAMDAIDQVANRLSGAFDAIKRIEEGNPKSGWSFEEIRDFLLATWDYWPALRQAIRQDLGLES